ncbi:MAG: hypothetical protein HOV81_21270 [Kofleriaceae bacterium]|nr:hypothetical protein [Kofleriaceae bacterium]
MQLRWALVATMLVACGDDGPKGTTDGAGSDSGTPITAPNEQWTYVELPGMTCGNGAATGIGVNLTNRSDQVVIFFQGGGACWDETTCFTVKSAINIETGYTASSFASEQAAIAAFPLFQRGAANPLRDASYVYVPYCTGDLHDGENVATYGARTVHHVGATNADIILSRLHDTRPGADTVWLVGISAGAYGVGFNFGAAHRTWPGAHVHALADSSPLVELEPTRWAAMQASWRMRFPAACTTCMTDLGAMPAALRAETPAGDRYGLLSNTRDQTISTYFGLTQDQLRTRLLAEQAAMSGDQAAFLVEGTAHVLLGNLSTMTSDGQVLSTWVTQWATGDPAWANAGP